MEFFKSQTWEESDYQKQENITRPCITRKKAASMMPTNPAFELKNPNRTCQATTLPFARNDRKRRGSFMPFPAPKRPRQLGANEASKVVTASAKKRE